METTGCSSHLTRGLTDGAQGACDPRRVHYCRAGFLWWGNLEQELGNRIPGKNSSANWSIYLGGQLSEAGAKAESHLERNLDREDVMVGTEQSGEVCTVLQERGYTIRTPEETSDSHVILPSIPARCAPLPLSPLRGRDPAISCFSSCLRFVVKISVFITF